MFSRPPKPPEPTRSPCNGICTIAEDGFCEGCARNRDEIANWGLMSEAERRRLVEVVLPEREAKRG